MLRVIQGTQDAQRNAYKLSVMLGNSKNVVNYLMQHQNSHKDSSTTVEDACQFSMPEDDNWHVPTWQAICQSHLAKPSFSNSLALEKAPTIQRVFLSQDKALNVTQETEEVSNIRSNIAQLVVKNKAMGAMLKQTASNIKELKSKMGKGVDQGTMKKQLTRLELQKKTLIADKKDIGAQLCVQNKQLRSLTKQPSNLISKTPLKNILEHSLKIRYKRADEDMTAAKVFSQCQTKGEHIPEASFNSYLDDIRPNITNSDKIIPPIIIDGNDVGAPGYFLCKLSDNDPKAAVLGYLTGCCQSIGKKGEAVPKHGMTSERSGFYVVCRGKVPKNGNSLNITPKNIVAQTWAWAGNDNKRIIFDSIESGRMVDEMKVTRMFHACATSLANNHNLHVNAGYRNLPKALQFSEEQAEQIEIDPVAYGDSNIQFIISDPETPCVTWLDFMEGADFDKSWDNFQESTQSQHSINLISQVIRMRMIHDTDFEIGNFINTFDSNNASLLMIHLLPSESLKTLETVNKDQLTSMIKNLSKSDLEHGFEVFQNRNKAHNYLINSGNSKVLDFLIDNLGEHEFSRPNDRGSIILSDAITSNKVEPSILNKIINKTSEACLSKKDSFSRSFIDLAVEQNQYLAAMLLLKRSSPQIPEEIFRHIENKLESLQDDKRCYEEFGKHLFLEENGSWAKQLCLAKSKEDVKKITTAMKKAQKPTGGARNISFTRPHYFNLKERAQLDKVVKKMVYPKQENPHQKEDAPRRQIKSRF